MIIVGALLGRNIDHFINIWGGLAFMGFGVLLLALLESDANFFAFSMANVIVSFIIGVVLFTAGLYGRTGSVDMAAHEDSVRHSLVQRDHA